ncbi:MAG: molybdopterin-dependent oxidoreductase [Desulfosudis oleivorans]|nr:molybdopterin-dependent oxidoreductase [Desulfosudis oleivorans]
MEDGRLMGVKGDPDHPHSHGYTCPKGRAAPEMIYHPDRITKPLVKVGGKTGTRFEEASWDKALDIIAENLLAAKEKWGAESVVFGTGDHPGHGALPQPVPRALRVAQLHGASPT